jgi:death on curing protein
MMRYLTLDEVLELHRMALEQSGGAPGLRDLSSLESAVAQPYMAFGGQDLYPTLADKGTALAFSLIKNHPFVDSNKRAGHAAMETYFVLSGFELTGDVDEQERIILGVAARTVGRDEFAEWVRLHLVARAKENDKSAKD